MNRFDTRAILDAINAYDPQDIAPELIAWWHDHIGHLPKTAALEAVAIHHKTSGERITPQHVLAIAAQIAERKPSQRPMRRAIMQTYTLTGAINDHCPRCKAEPGETCTNPETGHETHSPCLVRLVGKEIPA